MKLDDIFDNWSTDSKIDRTNLGDQSLEIPNLHSKYIKLFSMERLSLQKLENDYKQLYKTKYEYYSGSLDLDTIKEMGWQPNPKLILKTDLNMHIEADKDIQTLTLKIGIQKEKITLLDSIMDNLKNRGFHIRAAIDFKKFQAGY